MGQIAKNRPRLMRSAKRSLIDSKVDNMSLVLIGGLLIVIGMMLRG